jgi:LacI family repressor for deo operon, udp, cdd, tsx, nupC, and nupG
MTDNGKSVKRVSKSMSIKKVAAMAGVSIATVSRSFSHPELLKKETLEKVERARTALQYYPNSLAQNFRRGKSGVIIVIIENIGDPVYEKFTRTISRIAQSKGYDILIKETNFKTLGIKYYRDILSSKQADGLIVIVDPPKMNNKNQSLFDELPIIFISNNGESASYRQIGLDNYAAAQTAAQHLIDLGHKNMACITLDTENSAYVNREKGFTETLMASNRIAPVVIKIDQKQQSPDDAVNDILTQHPTVTAIFCTNDDIAIDVLAKLKQENVNVPNKISVIGFNNIRYSTKTNPPLTTIEYPLSDIAQCAIKTLCSIIDNTFSVDIDENSNKNLFFHQLIVRSSTTIPPK